MACCGQNRAENRSPGTTESNRGKVRVEYLGRRHLTFFSSASIRSYTFSTDPSQRVQWVQARDAALLLRRRDFRRWESR